MKKLIGMSVALAATLLASPMVVAENAESSVVKTQILKVEAPESSQGMYSVLSTADDTSSHRSSHQHEDLA